MNVFKNEGSDEAVPFEGREYQTRALYWGLKRFLFLFILSMLLLLLLLQGFFVRPSYSTGW